MTWNQHEPILAVDGHWGQYAWQRLTERFVVYGISNPELRALEYGPDGKHYHDAIDAALANGFVIAPDGVWWHIDQIDGDIFLFHPDYNRIED